MPRLRVDRWDWPSLNQVILTGVVGEIRKKEIQDGSGRWFLRLHVLTRQMAVRNGQPYTESQVHNLTLWGPEQCEKFIKRVKVGMPCYFVGHLRYKDAQDRGNELLRYADIIVEYWQCLSTPAIANANGPVTWTVNRPDRTEEDIANALAQQDADVRSRERRNQVDQDPGPA